MSEQSFEEWNHIATHDSLRPPRRAWPAFVVALGLAAVAVLVRWLL